MMLIPFNIVFYKGTSLVSRIIRFLTHGNYSHCAMVIGRFSLLQLDWKTPVTIKFLEYKVNTYDIYELTFELTDDEKEQLLDFMRKRINTSYDWKFIISRGFNLTFNTRIIHSKEKYNCDELIVEAYRSVLGVDLLCGDYKMTPENLSKSKLLRKIN